MAMLPHLFSKDKKFINIIIETPKGCAAKYNYDKETSLFKLKKILPLGMVFPFHFGFIPHTKAEDGDPLDVLILMDEPSWPGCIIECTIIGVLEAKETKDNKTIRNDRWIAVANASDQYGNIKNISELDDYLQNEMINFFNTYTHLEKKKFKIISKKGADTAMDLIKKQIEDGND